MINIERSNEIWRRNRWTNVSGHIDHMAEIINIDTPENNHIVKLKIPDYYAIYHRKGIYCIR